MASYFELAQSFNRQGAVRVIRNASTKKELQEFVKANKQENLYFTVYTFTTLDKGRVVYESAVPDKIFCEIDGEGHGLLNEETWRDLRRVIEWCQEEEKITGQALKPQIFFSGSSGYHILFHLPEVVLLYQDSKIIQKLNNNIKKVSGSKLIDLQANNGFSQLRRIPNTLNHKSGFYCIPLTVEEAYNFPPEQVLDLAKKKRKLNNFDGNSDYFVDIIKAIDREFKTRKTEPKFTSPIHRVVLSNGAPKIRPCIFRMTLKPDPSYKESLWIALELLRCGYTDEEICQTFYGIRGPERYNDELTRKHVSDLRRKEIFAPSCKTLQDAGYCKPEWHKWVNTVHGEKTQEQI